MPWHTMGAIYSKITESNSFCLFSCRIHPVWKKFYGDVYAMACAIDIKKHDMQDLAIANGAFFIVDHCG
jgi:hypothetical protein